MQFFQVQLFQANSAKVKLCVTHRFKPVIFDVNRNCKEVQEHICPH